MENALLWFETAAGAGLDKLCLDEELLFFNTLEVIFSLELEGLIPELEAVFGLGF